MALAGRRGRLGVLAGEPGQLGAQLVVVRVGAAAAAQVTGAAAEQRARARAPPALAPIAVDGLLQLVVLREVVLGALVRIQVLHVLGAQREGGRRDGRGQVEALGDLAPNLLVDHLDQAAARHHELVELVQVEHLLRHDWNPVDGRIPVRHELEQLVQEVLALGVVADLVQQLELLLEGVALVGLDGVAVVDGAAQLAHGRLLLQQLELRLLAAAVGIGQLCHQLAHIDARIHVVVEVRESALPLLLFFPLLLLLLALVLELLFSVGPYNVRRPVRR